MRSKWLKRLIILTLLVLWGVSLALNAERNKQYHREMISTFQQIDTYGSFPLISSAVENYDIYDYSSYSIDGEMAYSFFYNSDNVEQELAVYGKYLLLHGYAETTPDEETEGILAVYHKTDDYKGQIKISQTEHGYELQLSGFPGPGEKGTVRQEDGSFIFKEEK